MRKLFSSFIPKGFLWRLTSLNVVVIAGAILLSGWAIYHTACFLVEGIGDFSLTRQQQFNATLFQYVFLFAMIAVFISSVVHFYLTKRLISPIKKLIEATKLLKSGTYPDPLQVNSNDEIGELVSHYNELLDHLQKNDQHRKKLVDDVSHELRTPIANLTGYLHALKSGDIKGDQQLFQSLHEQAKQLTDLIEQIERLNEWNSMTTEQNIKKEKIDITGIITQCVQMFSWKLEQANIKGNMNVERAELFIHIDGIQQVLNNLLDNAIHYYEGEEPITISGKICDTNYCISVTSPGKEIKKEDQLRIFERFYRIDHSRNRKTGGSGLGLAIVKEIIENHHGTIDVHSKAGMNTFSFILPFK